MPCCPSEFFGANSEQKEGKERISKIKLKQFQSGLRVALGQKCLFFLATEGGLVVHGFFGSDGHAGEIVFPVYCVLMKMFPRAERTE